MNNMNMGNINIDMIVDLLKEKFPEIDIDHMDLELYQNIILETESLKMKVLKRIKCKRCSWCCKFQSAMLTLEDIRRLCKYIGCKEKELYDKYIDHNKKIPYLKSPCPFLNGNECDIYHFRPKVCKLFPFTDFFLVTDPCIVGKEILDIIIKNRIVAVQSENFQKLYDDRIKLLDSITGVESSKGDIYQSIYIDKNRLVEIVKLLKNREDES